MQKVGISGETSDSVNILGDVTGQREGKDAAVQYGRGFQGKLQKRPRYEGGKGLSQRNRNILNS